MCALKLWSKLCIIGRYSLLGGSTCKSKLNDFVFYNLKPVKIDVACIEEQNVTQDRTFDKRTKDKFNKNNFEHIQGEEAQKLLADSHKPVSSLYNLNM